MTWWLVTWIMGSVGFLLGCWWASLPWKWGDDSQTGP